MFKTIPIPMVGPSGYGRAIGQNARRAINLFMETDDAGGKSKVFWIGTPGLASWATPTAAIRGWLNWDDTYLYYVAGNKLYRMTTAGVESAPLGTVLTSSGNVDIKRNRTQIEITDGSIGSYYVYDTVTATFSTVNKWSTVTAITTMTRSGLTVTVTAQAHRGATSDTAKVWGANNFQYNTFADVSITVSDANTFTYALTMANLTAMTVSSITRSGGTATVTTSTDHNYTTSDEVLMAGAADSAYNGVKTITVTGGTTFTFTVAGTPADEDPASGVTCGKLPATPDGGVNALVAIRTDALTIQPQRCAQMDSYGILQNARTDRTDGVTSGQFYTTAGDDFTTVRISSMGEVKRDPDPVVVPSAPETGGHLYFLGSYSTEVWYNDGNSAWIPFIPIRTAAIPWGCLAQWSVAELGQGIAWLGRQKRGPQTVFLLESGYKPTEIASKAVADWLEGCALADLEAAYAFSWRERGHDFYALTVGTKTMLYDHQESENTGTPCWSEWTSSGGASLAKLHVYFAGKHLFAASTAAILEGSYETYTDLGAAITRQGVSGYVYSEDKSIVYQRVAVDIEPPGAAGSLLLETSDDEGTTWVSHGAQILTGAAQRVEWFNCGLSRTDRLFRLTTADAIKFAVLGMWADIEVQDA